MKIDLTIICARNLKIQNNTIINPYISFKIHDEKYKTSIKEHKSNPEWNERFSIEIEEGEHIIFNCYDKNILGKEHIGKCEWIVPQLKLKEYEYFFLPIQNLNGSIVISVCCSENNSNNIDTILPYCDVYQNVVLKLEILQIDHVPLEISNEKYPSYSIGEFTTSYGNYHRNISKYIKHIDDDKQIEKKGKVYYLQVSTGERMQFKLIGKQEKDDENEIIISTGEIIIPDYYENERIECCYNCSNEIKLFSRITCLKSVYRNVIKTMIPRSKKGNYDICFPGLFYIESLTVFDSIMNAEYKDVSYISFETEGIESQYWIWKNDFSTIHPDQRMELNKPMKVHVHIGRQCKVKVMIINENNQQHPTSCIFEESFIWPSSLMEKCYAKLDCCEEDEEDLTPARLKGYCIRQRELSQMFQQMYLSTNNLVKDEYIPIQSLNFIDIPLEHIKQQYEYDYKCSQYPSFDYYDKSFTDNMTSSFN